MKMTRGKLLLTLLGGLLMAAAILFFGLKLSATIDNDLRKAVDKNPVAVKAVVTRKSSHKGRSVYFKYDYKGKTYTNSEGGQFYYDKLNNNDTIEIRLDSTDPGNSYITWPVKE
jgi:hypothetical protein